MGVVTYTVVEGEIISETRNGVERDYVPDPLGSTIALLDGTQTKTDTFSYWPYGEERTVTGSISTPYRFVGTLGYRKETSSRTYVRARHLRVDQGRWMQRDPLWPQEAPFGYADNRPTTRSDESGRGWRHKECEESERRSYSQYCRALYPGKAWTCIGLELLVCGVKVKEDYRCLCHPDFIKPIKRIRHSLRKIHDALCVSCKEHCALYCPYDPDTCGSLCTAACLALCAT